MLQHSHCVKTGQQASSCNIGVIVVSNMTMSPQVHNIVKAAFYHLRNIAQVRMFISPSTTEVLINAFVSSNLDFCNPLLYGLPKYQISKLQFVQNAATCVVVCLHRYDHITETLKELHWLPVQQRTTYNINFTSNF